MDSPRTIERVAGALLVGIIVVMIGTFRGTFDLYQKFPDEVAQMVLDERHRLALGIGFSLTGSVLCIVLAAAMGPNLRTTIIALGIVGTPAMARVVRSAVFSEYGEDYVTAARLLGTRPTEGRSELWTPRV
jgi:ABC-type dipeptide/oligopeptide/nickel transport system permease subunit